MTTQRLYVIAFIPGDGIGLEVTPPALRCLEAAAKRFGFQLEFRHYLWASCTYFHEHGTMLPPDWKKVLHACDAIYFGAGMMVTLGMKRNSLWSDQLVTQIRT